MKLGFDKTHILNQPRHPVMATIVTAQFDDTIKAYKKVLGYKQLEKGKLSEAMATHWGLPKLAGFRMAILAPKSRVPVFLRFIEVTHAQQRPPSCGWFALEICVRDVEALYKRLMKSKTFTPFAKPTPLAFTDRVYPMQCQGPAGEILYLNEVRGSLPDIDLPIAKSDVDHLFIAILSAADMEHANEFYGSILNMSVNERHEIAYKTINRVHGLPLETRHKLSTLGGPRHVGLEIDQYPGLANPPRAITEETMTTGVLIVSFVADAQGILPERHICSNEVFSQAPYRGAKSTILIGPAGERAELISLLDEQQ